MQTFDQSLMSLLRRGLITYEEALRQSTNPDDFALRVSGIASTSDSSWDDFEGGAQPTVPSAPPSNFAQAASSRSLPPTPMAAIAASGRYSAVAPPGSVAPQPARMPAVPSGGPSTLAPQRMPGSTAPPSMSRPSIPSSPPPGQARTSSAPGLRPAQAPKPVEPPSDDDFQIERF